MPGGSWKTGIVGWVLVASSVLGLIGDSIAKSGIPDTLQEWFMFGTALAAGIGAIMSKDYDVSNSRNPAAATVVAPAAAATANPAATPSATVQ